MTKTSTEEKNRLNKKSLLFYLMHAKARTTRERKIDKVELNKRIEVVPKRAVKRQKKTK